MRMKEALRRALVERGEAIVTDYTLFLVLLRLYRAGQFGGEPISKRVDEPTENEFRYYNRVLRQDRYLRFDDDLGRAAYRVSDVPDAPAEDIAALADPFCYISHLSAMQRYGLTNRAPEALSLTVPKDWSRLSNEREKADYGGISESDAFSMPLRRITLPEKIRGRRVTVHTTVRNPEIKAIRGSAARITAVGEVFVQMLDRPNLCGGMSHVIDVWDKHASTYLEEIIGAVDAATEKIIKVRAGYLLEERLKLQDPRIEAWLSFAQRGGSRLLDPSRPYVSIYSEKWMISLNAESTEGSE